MLLRSSSNRKPPAWPVPSEKMTTFLPIAKSSYDNQPLSILGGMVWKLILIFFRGSDRRGQSPASHICDGRLYFYLCGQLFRRRLFIIFSERAHTQGVMPFAELSGISRMTP